MKTLLVTRRTETPITWLETDDGFKTLFGSDPDVIREVDSLEPGKRLFFWVLGERETSPRVSIVVRRLVARIRADGSR